jgi:hypothetical protein
MPVFYMDYELGIDSGGVSTNTPLGWWSVAYTGGTAPAPAADEVVSQGASQAKLTVVVAPTGGTWAGNNASGVMYFYGKTTAFAAGQVDFAGGGHMDIAADFNYNPWKTITSGATAARIAPGDTIRIAKSPAPSGKGFATWTNLSKTVTLTAQTVVAFTDGGGGLILATKAGHNFATGDIVTVSASTDYDGTYAITVASSSTFTFTAAYGADRTGTVTPAFCMTVDMCETAWTPNAVGDCTGAGTTRDGTDWKEGTYSAKFITDAAVQTNIMQAFYATGTLDLSKFQKLSFWIKNQAAIAVDSWEIKLCSDVAGATEVDNFSIPAIPYTTSWIPLTLARDGGGNLGAAIKSIAIWSHSTAPTASKYVFVDNFIACTTNGLNLQSLISKNQLEQSSTASVNASEGWYGIQSINGTTVLLDNTNNTLATAGRGYSTAGTSPETVATYKRETIKTAMVDSGGYSVQVLQESGTAGLLESYEGGYDTALNTQIGESFYDGLNGYGYGLAAITKSFNSVRYLSFYRYEQGLRFTTAPNTNNTFYLSNLCNNSNYALVAPFYNSSITILNVNNGVDGISMNICEGSTFNLRNFNNNLATTANISIGASSKNTFNCNNIMNNGNSAFNIASGNVNVINNAVTANNTTSVIAVTTAIVYLNNCTMSEATKVSGQTAFAGSKVFSTYQSPATTKDNWIYTDAGTINSQVAVRHTASGQAWMFSPGSTRLSNYPLTLSIARIACTGGKAITFKAWMKKDHATNVACWLRVPGGQDPGIPTDITVTKGSADTNWEELTLAAFTPTNACVIEILAEAWYVAGVSYAYVDDITVSEAT